MAQNPLNITIAELLDLGLHCIAGLGTQGAAIGILQYTQGNYSPFVTALTLKQNAFIVARSAYAAAVSDLSGQRELMIEACGDARLLFMITLSREWSEAWVAAGWEDGTTAVPRDLPGLKALCNAIFSYLNTNVDFVVDTVKITFTAQRFQDLLGGAATLEPVVTSTKVALGIARDARKTDEANLRTNTRGLIDVLATKLDPMSPLWDAFGLNRPGADVTPGAPDQPVLAKVAGGNVLAQTAAVATATYYRWFAQLTGVDPDFRFLGRTDDPTKVIDDLPANGTLKEKAEAANEAGPGTAGEAGTIVLGV